MGWGFAGGWTVSTVAKGEGWEKVASLCLAWMTRRLRQWKKSSRLTVHYVHSAPTSEAPMSSFARRAAALQTGVKHDENRSLEMLLDDYSDAQVRQSAVHTRLDVVMLVSLLEDLNVQVRRLVWIGLIALAMAILRMAG